MKKIFTYAFHILIWGFTITPELYGQWASPSLNPTFFVENPAVVAWKNVSTISFSTIYGNGYKGDFAYQDNTITEANFVLAGELGPGIYTGLQIVDKKQIYTTSYDDGSKEDSNNTSLQYRTGAASIGPLALGYTDTGNYEINNSSLNKSISSTTDSSEKGEAKIERSGISLRFGEDKINFFTSFYEHKNTASYDLKSKITDSSNSSWLELNTSITDFEIKQTGYGIGIIFGKPDENRYRIEVFQENKPKIDHNITFYITNSAGTSNTDNGKISDDEKSKLGGIIEANINEITVSIGTQLEKIYDSGVDGTYKYGNTSTQSFFSSLYFTMFKPICIGLYANTSEKLQLYNHGLRRQYETLDEFGLTISYQI